MTVFKIPPQALPQTGKGNWIEEIPGLLSDLYFISDMKVCPTVTRLCTAEELDVSLLADWEKEIVTRFGGRMADSVHYPLQTDLISLVIGDTKIDVPRKLITKESKHTWADWGGTLQTCCKVCDCDGMWDRKQFKYIEKK